MTTYLGRAADDFNASRPLRGLVLHHIKRPGHPGWHASHTQYARHRAESFRAYNCAEFATEVPDMAEILRFQPRRPRKLGLCQHGFHAWKICKEKRFDVKAGKLVTAYECSRCGATRTTGT